MLAGGDGVGHDRVTALVSAAISRAAIHQLDPPR
jgi:hypothetical protein